MPPDDEITNTATEVIGAGGMGVVYRARDPELNRDVAIKVVGSQGGRSQERLLAEARAMAKLDHPSLMPVFDVGAIESGVFVVMPYLTGGTLHDWIHAQPRPWRDVVERFAKAGRGLAAAHAAGLVHRDFKPRNVLLDGDEVRVADFGLVATDETTTAGGPANASSIGGTPGYMAPEQARGETVDARADQFSFSVSLWEGLHGERPQQAETRTSAALAPAGVPAVPDTRVDSPLWLRQVVARGFCSQRDARWPSMSVLLDRLERRKSRRWTALFIGGTVAGAAVVASLVLTTKDDAAACPVPEARLQGAWDLGVRTQLTQAFGAIDPAAAAEAIRETSATLDTYALAWKVMHVDACRAHALRRETPEVLDRRMSCLDRRLSLLRALTATLASTTDRRILDESGKLAASLPRIDDCGDSMKLMALAPRPADAAVRARIAEIDDELDSIQALKWRGEHLEQLKRAEAAVARARETGDPAILARSLHLLTKAQTDNGKDATEHTKELAQVATAAGMHELAAKAWLQLLASLTSTQVSYEEARALEEAAHAAVVRAGSTDELRFQELYMGAARAGNSGEFQLARERFQMALALAVKPALRAEIEGNIAKMTMILDGPSAALPGIQASLRVFEEIYGPDHALVSDPLLFLAQVLRSSGDVAGAKPFAERALAIQDRTLPRDSHDRGVTLQTLGNIEGDLGNDEAAIKLIEEAAEIFEKAGDVSRHAGALATLGRHYFNIGGLGKARSVHERALTMIESTMGKDSIWYAQMEMQYAETLVSGGACRETPALLEHIAAVLGKETPSYVADTHWLRARCLLAARKTAAAIVELEKADALCRSGDCNSGAHVRWMLGKILVERATDQSRGEELIEKARSQWVSAGLTRYVAEVDAWRSKR